MSGQKLGHEVKSYSNHEYTLEGTVWIQSSWNFVRMFMWIKNKPEYKKGHVGSKIRSLGKIFVKPWIHSRGHSYDPIFLKLCQNVYLDKS